MDIINVLEALLGASPGLDQLKTPSTNGGDWSAKKKLRSPSDTGESCSQGDGLPASKKSRLLVEAPELWPAKSEQAHSDSSTDPLGRFARSRRPSSSISKTLLINFEESMLKGRFPSSVQIEGFQAIIKHDFYCFDYKILPVQVTYCDMSDHGRPAPFLGVISLELLGEYGYTIPDLGNIVVSLCSPHETVMTQFTVPYDFSHMPQDNTMFLRYRKFLVSKVDGKKILHSLIQLGFRRSTSGKLFLHGDIRLLFQSKSIKVYTVPLTMPRPLRPGFALL